MVRRGGSIGCGVRAVKRLVEAGVQVNGKTFSQLMKIAHEQMKRGRANLDDTADVVKLARDCGVEPDLFLYNAWLSATATAASQGKADLSDGSKVLLALRAGGINPDVVTFNSYPPHPEIPTEFRNLKPGTRNPEPEIGNPKPGT